MRAKFIKESVIFVPKTKTELEQNFKNDTKIKYFEKILGLKLNVDDLILGGQSIDNLYFNIIEKIKRNFTRITKKRLILTRDRNIGDFWIINFVEILRDEDEYEYQIGLILELSEWEPEDRLKAAGFSIATWDGTPLETGLTLADFIKWYNNQLLYSER